MKKFLMILIALSFCLSGCNNQRNENTNNQENTYNYNTSRTSALNNTTNTVNDSNNTNNVDNINTKSTESKISSFSTKIYTPNDTARQNNIQVTCSELNGTVVKSRRNFFFL